MFGDQRSIGFEQGYEEIESSGADLDRYAVSEQLPLAQQHPEAAKFKSVTVCGYASWLRNDRRIVAVYYQPPLLLLGQW